MFPILQSEGSLSKAFRPLWSNVNVFARVAPKQKVEAAIVKIMKNASRGIIEFYNMAQVTSGKIARCDWLLTWQDFSVMTAGIMKIVNAL